MTDASLQYIVARLVERACGAAGESRKAPDDMFLQGRREAYYEMLDILKSELDAHDADLKEFSLAFDVDALL